MIGRGGGYRFPLMKYAGRKGKKVSYFVFYIKCLIDKNKLYFFLGGGGEDWKCVGEGKCISTEQFISIVNFNFKI